MAETASQPFLLRFSRWAGAIVTCIGAVVLVGWLFNVQILKSVLPGSIAMHPLTALLFLSPGIARSSGATDPETARSAGALSAPHDPAGRRDESVSNVFLASI